MSNSGALPYGFAKRHGVLLHDQPGAADAAQLICRESASLLALGEVRRHLGTPVAVRRVGDAEFDTLLSSTYDSQQAAASSFIADLGSELDLASLAEQIQGPEDLLESADSAPVIRLINALLSEAIRDNASDIHLEPYAERMVVRMRVDGALREILAPERALATLLASRIKIMAKLDIAEKRLPQDGRISVQAAGRAVDLRVSTIPSVHGERIVLRLLDKQAARLDLEQLGMAPELLARLSKAISNPHGIVLVTGPTGSGKTTTLYAALSRLKDATRNILTVEDPIEYDLDGIGQTQVNPRVDMTFARGLRAILRQDPDIVMVGEIRDLETAQIAVQASLTGHLVLSTLHTNTAAGAITRLQDLGVEPFLLSSSLTAVLAQRLVRRLCPHCKTPYTATAREFALLGIEEQEATLYRAMGCEACGQTGYRGRRCIVELLIVDEPLRALIHDGAGETALANAAIGPGETLFADGRRLVLEGDTTLEELLRVSRDH